MNPHTIHPPARLPRATYRLQLSERLRLLDVLALVPYLRDLGVSHLYVSPLLKAVPHSPHGYDVCDFSELNPDLGTESDLAALVKALRRWGMGLVLDIVPNHMGIGSPENRWWWDVLTYGQDSQFAACFDIDWGSEDPRLRGKVLIPTLEDRYDRILRRGAIQLAFERGRFTLRYGEQRFPVAPDSSLFRSCVPWVGARPDESASSAAMTATADNLNADPDALDALIQEQHYRLAFHRHGDADLNYRRFFDVSGLAGLRVEDDLVFARAHALVLTWVQKGWLDGLRVDHPDGLRDPERYLQRLRRAAPDTWIVVEKILTQEETLPVSWPVAGTTGYDFLRRVGGILIDADGKRPLTDFYAAFTGEPVDYPAVVRENKRLVLDLVFRTEVARLTRLLTQIATRHWRCRDFTQDELRDAVIELAVSLAVYRTYVGGQDAGATETDARRVGQAVERATQRRPSLAPELFDFLGRLLLLEWRGDAEREFVARFQQLTGPAMAKGVEDTAFYCFNRLVALNEVGGDPARFSSGVDEFHEGCRRQQARWPDSMLATSTHDTKRSEDVRARLSLLCEIPDAWSQAVLRWSRMNERHRQDGWPDRNAEYLFYQTLVGAWPLPVERALAYMEKAAREARQHTGWAAPNTTYEAALRRFVAASLRDVEFVGDVARFVEPLVEAGWINSLAQTLLKLTAPGVPDIYQGTELWDLSLVDPDNRRPVDFDLRRRLTAEGRRLSAAAVWGRRQEGIPKSWLIRKVLELRRGRPALFAGVTTYEPLFARGPRARHVVAFVRGGAAISVAPRLPLSLLRGMRADESGGWAPAACWDSTTLDLPPGGWRNELTCEDISNRPASVADLLRTFPVALLVRKETP